MLRKLPSLLPLLVLLLAVVTPLRSLAQKTITVNGNTGLPGYPYPTIQSGIDAAVNGDTVLVTPIVDGSYNETIDFKGKAITVTGRAAGADATATLPVMQSSGIGPSVVFQTGETSSSVFLTSTFRRVAPLQLTSPPTLGSTPHSWEQFTSTEPPPASSTTPSLKAPAGAFMWRMRPH